ncbi:MAG: hypothetical protein Q8O67_31090 [Deltaproteobacteria bacterium]|nr:hypothetical protein [Deltaproteobacteria bacterium]
MSVVVVPKPVNAGRDTAARRRARAALVDVLWDRHGRRRLPPERELVDAITACDARDLWWVCEASSAGPLYLLPTREWLTHLCALLDEVKAKKILEVAAGDGFLSACLQRRRPDLRVVATDDFSWTAAQQRSSERDRAEFGATPFAGIQPLSIVQKQTAAAAIEEHRPDVVIVSWPPPGTLVERVIRAPRCQLVLDLSVDGDVCGNGMKTWRFEKEFLEGPLEQRALCRLDARPLEPRQTRATLYYGRAHPLFGTSS